MRKILVVVVAVVCGASVVSCAPPEDMGNIEVRSSALDSSHRRVMQECSQAMWGSWTAHDETNWPTGTTYASYTYSSSDTGAWNLLLANTGGYADNGTYYSGFYTSCMRYRSQGYLPAPYTVCQLSLSTGYGSYEMPSYTCQGYCPGAMRGGQCKPFMNLVAYRSGTYQLPGYGFKLFPNDTCIAYTSATCNLPPAQRVARPDNDTNMPKATYENISEGDYLRRPYGHALIVVRKISSSQVIVLDSNWVGGDGAETVASHSMAFGSGDSNSNLGAYRVLKCAYTGAC